MLISLLVFAALGVAFALHVLHDHRTLAARVERLAEQLETVGNLRSATLRSAVIRAAQPLKKRYEIGLTVNDGILKLLSEEEMGFWNDHAITLPSITIEHWRGHTMVRVRFHEKGVAVVNEWFRLGGAHGTELRLWEAELGTDETGYSMLTPRVVVVLDGERLRFGAEGGRFGWSLPDGGPRKEHTFDSLSLEFSSLSEAQKPSEDDERPAYEWSIEYEQPGTAIDWYVRAFDVEKFSE